MLVLLGGLIATAAVAFTRDNVARRGRAAPVLTAASPDEVADPDPSVGVTHARSSLGPVPRTDTAREESASSIGATRGRSTLGSVPRAGSASREGLPDDVAQQAPQLRKAGTSGRPQS